MRPSLPPCLDKAQVNGGRCNYKIIPNEAQNWTKTSQKADKFTFLSSALR
jgi:hypothetical protein